MLLHISISSCFLVWQSISINLMFVLQNRWNFFFQNAFGQWQSLFQWTMSEFLTFKNILFAANAVMNLSGFFCVSIDGVSFKRQKSFKTKFFFSFSVIFSLFAYSYRTFLPIRSITHSQILEFLVNTLNKWTVYSQLILKIINIRQYREYYQILENLQFCNLNVRILFFDKKIGM